MAILVEVQLVERRGDGAVYQYRASRRDPFEGTLALYTEEPEWSFDQLSVARGERDTEYCVRAVMAIRREFKRNGSLPDFTTWSA